ncbi:MAG: TonB family protein [Acidobacteriaceae bacterium]|nr:TonB family protein [Acidobacteriaceae bacterium]
MASQQQLSTSKYTLGRAARLIELPTLDPQFFYAVPPRRGWDRFGLSVAIHVVGLILLTQIVINAPQEFRKVSTRQSVTLIAPAPYQPSHAVPPPPPRIKAPEPKVLAELRPPKIAPLPKPELQPTPVPKPVLPPVIEQASLPAPTPVVPKQAPHVQATNFGGGSSAPPTVKAPVRDVQTGGFGDPNGVPGTGKKDAKVTIASLGAFDLPAGGGYGNGSGGTHGIRGTVASAGFGNGIAGPGNGNGRGPGSGRVLQAGFGDATPAAPSAPRRAEAAKPQLTPVEIISKPRPIYTDEARKMHLQGEVLLDVMFTAGGQVRVLRVVRGLGHGLDEAALRAAEQIHFKPALREGQPYDSNAVVHIVFELAE